MTWEEVGGMFIVRFTEYKMAAEHRRRLEEGLAGSQIHWNWVDRQNSAAQHPTDFGLLNINVTDVDTAKARISVHLDRILGQGTSKTAAASCI